MKQELESSGGDSTGDQEVRRGLNRKIRRSEEDGM
jgi:hypothetical protein